MKSILAAALIFAAASAHAVAVPASSTDYAGSLASGTTATVNNTGAATGAVVSSLPPIVTSRVNPMLNTPTLVLKGCAPGKEWYKEPGVAGAIAFCRTIPVVVIPVVEPVVVADSTATAGSTTVVTSPTEPVVPPATDPMGVVSEFGK